MTTCHGLSLAVQLWGSHRGWPWLMQLPRTGSLPDHARRTKHESTIFPHVRLSSPPLFFSFIVLIFYFFFSTSRPLYFPNFSPSLISLLSSSHGPSDMDPCDKKGWLPILTSQNGLNSALHMMLVEVHHPVNRFLESQTTNPLSTHSVALYVVLRTTKPVKCRRATLTGLASSSLLCRRDLMSGENGLVGGKLNLHTVRNAQLAIPPEFSSRD